MTTDGPSPRKVVIARNDRDWAAWVSLHSTDRGRAARVSSVDDVAKLKGMDPGGWQVEIAGAPDAAWLSQVVAELRAQGFDAPAVFRGAGHFR